MSHSDVVQGTVLSIEKCHVWDFYLVAQSYLIDLCNIGLIKVYKKDLGYPE